MCTLIVFPVPKLRCIVVSVRTGANTNAHKSSQYGNQFQTVLRNRNHKAIDNKQCETVLAYA